MEAFTKMYSIKSRKMFFIAAAIMLVISACQNSIPVSLNTSGTSLMAVVKNATPLQAISTTYFSLPPVSCNDSQYLKDVTIEDGTPVDPGATFIKKWQIKNTGSCGWTRRYSLQFATGERMSGETIYLEKWVPPGQSIVISVELVAPKTEGTHTSYWVLTNSLGEPFGNYFYLKIIV